MLIFVPYSAGAYAILLYKVNWHSAVNMHYRFSYFAAVIHALDWGFIHYHVLELIMSN